MQEAYGLEIPQTLEETCTPNRLALIVYDMQIGVLRQIQNRAEVIAKVSDVLSAARKAGIRVVFMRHLSLPRELMGVFQFRMAMAWQRVSRVEDVQPWFTRDAPGFQLTPEMAPLPTEAIFDKITMSAFEGTPLDIALRDCGISSFAIVGVATEIGIEPTIRHGADLGYVPVVIADACGAGHDEAGARAFASLRFLGDAIFTDVASFREVLERQGRPAGSADRGAAAAFPDARPD
jgi:biuret amidohydrolase